MIIFFIFFIILICGIFYLNNHIKKEDAKRIAEGRKTLSQELLEYGEREDRLERLNRTPLIKITTVTRYRY